MSESSEEVFEDAFRRSYGAVLVTGPTGSGKSTTLYAALNEINGRSAASSRSRTRSSTELPASTSSR